MKGDLFLVFYFVFAMNLKSVWGLFKETINEFNQDRVLRLAAATAYYAIFSIGPLLVLVAGLGGLIFGQARVRIEVTRQVGSFVGPKSAEVIDSMMSAQLMHGSRMATLIGAVVLFLGATGAFGQLQDSLNTIWGVTTKPGQSIVAFIRDRFFSLAMVLVIAFLLLVSMALTAFVNIFAKYLATLISVPPWLAPVFNAVLSVATTALLFALIFKILPDVKIRWRHVRDGAIGTALLFAGGQHLLALYLKHETSAAAYGAGSAFMAILLYVYYSSVILYLGAEFTQVYARFYGSRLEPSKYAIRITDHERAEQGMPTNEQIERAARRNTQPAQGAKPGTARPGSR